MKKTLFTICVLSLTFISYAQDSSKGNAGFGFGISYGGIGTKFTYLPSEKFGLFAGLGYNLNNLGYNLGAQLKFPSEKRANFYLTGMYGYNAVLIVTGSVDVKKTYYGPTFGVGIDLKSRTNTRNFWAFEFLVPIRDSQLTNDINALKSVGATVSDPLPIAFSVGYHIKF